MGEEEERKAAHAAYMRWFRKQERERGIRRDRHGRVIEGPPAIRTRKSEEEYRRYHSDYSKQWARENRDRINMRRRARYQADPEKFREQQRAERPLYRERDLAYNATVDPEKKRARNLVYKAVTRGKIVKPKCCERCGAETRGRQLHGHHADYSKPLEVTWLCTWCHKVVHRENDPPTPG